VRIHFAGRLAGKAFACGQAYEGVGAKSTTVTPQDLRFFVSGLALVRADGSSVPVVLEQDGVWQYQSVALVDLEDASGACRNGNPATHADVTGTVPEGSYTGLRFTLGVPFALDHMDGSAAPSPLNMTAMQWVWQCGYKFLSAELAAPGKTMAPEHAVRAMQGERAQQMSQKAAGFPVHIGSTGCASTGPDTAPTNECKHPNRAEVLLATFDPANDMVVFDLGKLLEHSDLSANSPRTSPGCMSFERDPDCVPIMEALGLAYDGSPARQQVVFYREAKQ